MNRRLAGQRGFTLIELMVATTVGLMLLMSVLTIMYQSAGMADAMRGQVVMNQEARQMFHMLTDGGVGSLGTAVPVPGMRGRLKGSVVGTQLKVNQRMVVVQAGSQIVSSSLPSTQIQCRGAADPIQECTGTETRTVDGYLAATPILTEPTGSSNQWVITSFDLIDPSQASNPLAAPRDFRSTYYTIIGYGKEQ